MSEQNSPITPDDWRRAADQVIKLSERVEASVPAKQNKDQGAKPRPPHPE
jgi:hypothetical protein